MAFDVTKPADNQKIRLGPADIRNNFSAIITADDTFIPTAINFTKRGADPAALANAVKVYVKADASTDPELFARDEDGNVIQLTEEGKLGGQSTGLWTNGISFNGGVYTNTQNSMCSAWALVASNGTLTSGFGLTSARNSTGDYTLTFSAAPASANYVVNGTVLVNLTRARVLYVYSRGAASFSVRTQAINASAGDYEDVEFMVAVFGAR